MSVLFNGDRLEVTAILSDAESVKQLIRVLAACRTLRDKRSNLETNGIDERIFSNDIPPCWQSRFFASLFG